MRYRWRAVKVPTEETSETMDLDRHNTTCFAFRASGVKPSGSLGSSSSASISESPSGSQKRASLQNASKQLNNQTTVVKKKVGNRGGGEEDGRGVKDFYNFATTSSTCIVLGHLQDLQEKQKRDELGKFSLYKRS